ncbi:hypothetical protein VTO73DRAFT_15420 [Trametes versicolor]
MPTPDVPSWATLPTPTPTFPLTFQTSPAGPSSPAESASASSGARRVPRRRYPQEVYDLLTQYYENVTAYPTKAERIAFVEQVKKIPGGEDYTQEKMNAYFAGKRTNQGMTKKSLPASDQPRAAHPPPKHAKQPPRLPLPERKPSLNTAQILYPSLITDPSILPKLDILLDDTPSPPLDVAKIWASRLGSNVQLNDIITYADLRLARMRRGDPPIMHSQLPTPDSSISPEPLSTPTSPVVETSWGKPAVKEEFEDELESEDDLEHEVRTELVPQTEAASDPHIMYIADKLYKALFPPSAPQTNGVQPPKTYKDLGRWFQEQQSAGLSFESTAKPPVRHAPAPTPDRRPSHPSGGRSLA